MRSACSEQWKIPFRRHATGHGEKPVRPPLPRHWGHPYHADVFFWGNKKWWFFWWKSVKAMHIISLEGYLKVKISAEQRTTNRCGRSKGFTPRPVMLLSLADCGSSLSCQDRPWPWHSERAGRIHSANALKTCWTMATSGFPILDSVRDGSGHRCSPERKVSQHLGGAIVAEKSWNGTWSHGDNGS